MRAMHDVDEPLLRRFGGPELDLFESTLNRL